MSCQRADEWQRRHRRPCGAVPCTPDLRVEMLPVGLALALCRQCRCIPSAGGAARRLDRRVRLPTCRCWSTTQACWWPDTGACWRHGRWGSRRCRPFDSAPQRGAGAGLPDRDNQLALTSSWDETCWRPSCGSCGGGLRSRPRRLRSGHAGTASGRRGARCALLDAGRPMRGAGATGHSRQSPRRPLAAGAAPLAVRGRHQRGRCSPAARRRSAPPDGDRSALRRGL
jgi:hypothetical protein